MLTELDISTHATGGSVIGVDGVRIVCEAALATRTLERLDVSRQAPASDIAALRTGTLETMPGVLWQSAKPVEFPSVAGRGKGWGEMVVRPVDLLGGGVS